LHDALPILHVFYRQAEGEEVFTSYLLCDFYVGAIHRADGDGAVHDELHVARARRLLAGQGYLFGQVGGRIDPLSLADVEIGQKDDLEHVANVGIVVHHLAYRGDQLDDELGTFVAGRGLAAENERAGDAVDVRLGLDAAIERDDVQHREVLTLVLVDALDQYVEDRKSV